MPLTPSPYKNKYAFQLNLGIYRESAFQNPPFYLHFLDDKSFVKSSDFGNLTSSKLFCDRV